jgi:hypothetical protein
MGYEDRTALVSRIVRATSELQNLIESYPCDLLPGQFQDQFAAALGRQAELLEALVEQFRSYGRAARSVHSGLNYLNVPDPYLFVDWYAVAGMPVWKVRRRDESLGASAFADYTPPPAEAEIVVYLDKYREERLDAVQAAALRLGNELGGAELAVAEDVLLPVIQDRGDLRG